MSDDAVGCLVAVALIGGIYWVSSHYEIRKKEETPTAPAAAAYKPPRPSGMIEIGATQSGTILRLNADSVRGDRKNRQGWVIEDASKDKTVTNWRFRHALYLIDCDTTAIRELSSLYYDAKGNSVFPSRSVDPKDAKPEYYPQGTVGYDPVGGMCTEAFDQPKP